MKTTQDYLTEAVQMIRDFGWWRGTENKQPGDTRKCAQQAISKVTSTESPSDVTYSEVMQELARRIQTAFPEFEPTDQTCDAHGNAYEWVTQFNDSQSTPDQLIALMEGRAKRALTF